MDTLTKVNTVDIPQISHIEYGVTEFTENF